MSMGHGLQLEAQWVSCGCPVCRAAPEAGPAHAWVSPPMAPEPRFADMHQAFEVGVLLSGQVEKHCGGYSFRPQVGDAWLVPGCEVHAWRFSAPQTRELTLHFLPELLGDESFGGVSWIRLFACPPETRPMPRSDAARRRVLAASEMLVEDLEARPPALVEGIRAGLVRLLVELYREWEHREHTAAEAEQLPGRVGRIMPALALVYSSPGRRVNLREAADACGFSYSYFDQVFRSIMGIAFAQFGMRTRLAHAARLSRQGERPVESIAEECGFVDASHLQRRFLEFYGCSPREYSGRSGTKLASQS